MFGIRKVSTTIGSVFIGIISTNRAAVTAVAASISAVAAWCERLPRVQRGGGQVRGAGSLAARGAKRLIR